MSNLKDRAAACLPLVPVEVGDSYAKAMTRLPRIEIALRRCGSSRDLPAVGSFYG